MIYCFAAEPGPRALWGMQSCTRVNLLTLILFAFWITPLPNSRQIQGFPTYRYI
ncbi:hypothetical protein BDV23DRAFT_156776 [Aspergillus alliaceus]|uniref:Uncharacterized protein n=1 Tax=Petromyces alliaceus TaxID=209559 RepID=A0A5N7C6I9_PETAA|nr:hypothetical protein BDV23DRAFT_156776 [Aspergillus alliaceus]